MSAYRDELEALGRTSDRLTVQLEFAERMRGTLEQHCREIEQSLAARSRFLAAASHELRTPINAIVGYNQLMHQGVYGALSEPQTAVAQKIASSASQLLALVNDILDLSKIDAGKVEIRRGSVDLPALVRDAAAAIEIHARAKGLELRTELPGAPLTLETDPARLRQILINLLSNAVKFTPGGSITLQIEHLEEGPAIAASGWPANRPGTRGWVRIAVRDTGIGIPREKLAAIFGEFVQLTRPDSIPREGTGLGLAISMRLARLLGGDLIVESEVDVHSTFTLLLPCPHPPADGAPPAG